MLASRTLCDEPARARAPARVDAMISGMFVDFNTQAADIGRAVYARNRDG